MQKDSFSHIAIGPAMTFILAYPHVKPFASLSTLFHTTVLYFLSCTVTHACQTPCLAYHSALFTSLSCPASHSALPPPCPAAQHAICLAM